MSDALELDVVTGAFGLLPLCVILEGTIDAGNARRK
jgi:hypothetical protein